MKKILINYIDELLIKKELMLFDLVNNYVYENKNHIYNKINNKFELFNIIRNNNHYLTKYDLLILSNMKKIYFRIYNGNKNPMDELSFIGNDSYKIIVDLLNINIFNINLYFYIYKIRK